MSRWLICSLIAISLPTPALTKSDDGPKKSAPIKDTRAPQLTIAQGAEITVEDYDAKTDTFLLSLVEEPAVGPNFVTPEMLRQAVAFNGDQRDFMRQKNQMIGSIFQVKKPLPLIREDDMNRRDKAARSNKRAF